MDADIVCVGFGPATAGFLATLSKQLTNADGMPAVESAVMPGMPPQVLCYERADDIGFGVSGVVTRAQALRASFPEIKTPASDGRASWRGKSFVSARPARREPAFGCFKNSGRADSRDEICAAIRAARAEPAWTPSFLHKHDGMILSMGQFMQWVGAQVQSTAPSKSGPAPRDGSVD